MPEHSYSLYVEKNDGHLFGPALMIQAENDDDAVVEALKFIANGFYAELRDDLRLVKTFNEKK